MIKIPATREGLPAITQTISEGININVTLLFAISAYQAVADAYLAGLEALAAAGGASNSRIDHGGRIGGFSVMDAGSSKTNGPEKLL